MAESKQDEDDRLWRELLELDAERGRISARQFAVNCRLEVLRVDEHVKPDYDKGLRGE